MITKKEREEKVMSKIKHLAERTVETLKKEGIGSFGKKVVNYVKLRTIARPKIEKIYGDVLFINGCTLPHPTRYRVDHQIEQLLASGMAATRIDYDKLTLDLMKYYRAFVFFRCPITDTVKQFIELAKENNKVVFFDIDDLVIDKKYTETIPYVKAMSKEEKDLYDDGVLRMQETLRMCDYAITTTERLKEELQNYVKEVYINRNVASERMAELSLKAMAGKVEHDDVVLGYLSGSITHNPDVELIKSVLVKLMKKYDFLKLKLIGEISVPEEFQEFEDRILFESFMSWENLPKVIASLDINLAPLEQSIFNEAKSENKWVEAALCQVVTVASDVGAFHTMIHNEEDGFLCQNEKDWEKVLTHLIEDKSLREKVAKKAYDRIIKNHITTYSSHGLAKYIQSKLARNIAFVLPTTNISGGVNVILRHISMLKNKGCDVFVINMDNNDQDVDSKWGKVSVIKKHKTKISGHIDTMVASLWSTLYYVRKCPNVSHRMYFVQNFETDFASFGQYMRIEANATYEDITGVKYITISKWCQNWLKERFEKETTYAPNGIDLNQFPFKKREFKGKIKILIEGNSDDYYKNVDESFKIVEKLDKNKYEIQFLSYQGEPKKWYYVDKFMHRVPYAEVGKVYQEADILIKSSILESFSYPPLEMMATGGLVVVAPNGGNVEYLKDGENCLLYEPGNIEDAVQKVEKLVEDEKLRDHLIKGGVATAKARDWEKIENDIIKMYEVK